jgi:hypothetical protein
METKHTTRRHEKIMLAYSVKSPKWREQKLSKFKMHKNMRFL